MLHVYVSIVVKRLSLTGARISLGMHGDAGHAPLVPPFSISRKLSGTLFCDGYVAHIEVSRFVKERCTTVTGKFCMREREMAQYGDSSGSIEGIELHKRRAYGIHGWARMIAERTASLGDIAMLLD